MKREEGVNKNWRLKPAVRETWVWSLGCEDHLEKEMAAHSSILAWKISWTEEPGGLQSMGSQRVGHDWATDTYLTRSSSHSSLVAQRVKHLPAMQETWVRSLGQEDPLEKEMATHSSTLAWKIPWTEKPGRLQSMGSQSRTRLSDFTSSHSKTHCSNLVITLTQRRGVLWMGLLITAKGE